MAICNCEKFKTQQKQTNSQENMTILSTFLLLLFLKITTKAMNKIFMVDIRIFLLLFLGSPKSYKKDKLCYNKKEYI